jgi:rubrerythrin
MMNRIAQTGHNVTGVRSSTGRADEMKRGMEQYRPTSVGTDQGAGKVRIQYAKEGEPTGSIPPPPKAKDKVKTAIGVAASPAVMDKLGERLAFERMGTRLYEALISKHEAYGTFEGGPTRDDLIEIMNEEHRHFAVLEKTITEAGGDPTAVTPSANLAAVASEGVLKVITDPRTTLLQSLEAILIAELTDRDSWAMLCELAEGDGLDQFVQFCEQAEQTEERHLERVREWLIAGQQSLE